MHIHTHTLYSHALGDSWQNYARHIFIQTAPHSHTHAHTCHTDCGYVRRPRQTYTQILYIVALPQRASRTHSGRARPQPTTPKPAIECITEQHFSTYPSLSTAPKTIEGSTTMRLCSFYTYVMCVCDFIVYIYIYLFDVHFGMLFWLPVAGLHQRLLATENRAHIYLDTKCDKHIHVICHPCCHVYLSVWWPKCWGVFVIGIERHREHIYIYIHKVAYKFAFHVRTILSSHIAYYDTLPPSSTHSVSRRDIILVVSVRFKSNITQTIYIYTFTCAVCSHMYIYIYMVDSRRALRLRGAVVAPSIHAARPLWRRFHPTRIAVRRSRVYCGCCLAWICVPGTKSCLYLFNWI